MSAVIARRPQRSAPAPAGLHDAVCVDVVDLGEVPSAYGVKHKVRLVWQLGTTDASGRRFELSRVYTLSLDERAALRQALESWRSKKFTDAELDGGFDLEKVLGVNCQLQAIHEPGGDGETYANVSAVLPARKGVAKLAPVNYVRQKDRLPRSQATAGGRR